MGTCDSCRTPGYKQPWTSAQYGHCHQCKQQRQLSVVPLNPQSEISSPVPVDTPPDSSWYKCAMCAVSYVKLCLALQCAPVLAKLSLDGLHRGLRLAMHGNFIISEVIASCGWKSGTGLNVLALELKEHLAEGRLPNTGEPTLQKGPPPGLGCPAREGQRLL